MPDFILPTCVATIAVGEVLQPMAPTTGMLTQYGALGVLAWVAWCQQRRQDRGEKQRHDDSEKLNVTLRDMTRHCAAQQKE